MPDTESGTSSAVATAGSVPMSLPVQELCAQLAGVDLQAAAAAAEALAELGKDEAAREAFGGAAGVWPALVGLLLRANGEAGFPAARQQALRAIGNLCYEHEANRKRLLDAGGVEALAGALAALTVW